MSLDLEGDETRGGEGVNISSLDHQVEMTNLFEVHIFRNLQIFHLVEFCEAETTGGRGDC